MQRLLLRRFCLLQQQQHDQPNPLSTSSHFFRFFNAGANTDKAFSKILIANRGEIACRVMRTAKRLGIKTVAVYSEPDSAAKHTRLADEAILIGGPESSSSYLRMDRILEAVKKSGAEAVHPGYGFLSENPAFVALLEENKVAFIGPGSHAMKAMGDKIESKRIAKQAGVHTIPGFLGEVLNNDQLLKIAHEIGYPIMIKASAGGGGKGMRIAWNDEEAVTGFRLSKQEAKSYFGDDRMLIEKFIDNPRHIEIQILSDGETTLYLNERECSIQRRNQKVIEEAPSPFIDPETRKAMGRQAVQLAQAVGYQSAGTVEMLVDSKRNFYFLEMNTRLQVEHPITEYITGIDIVEQMINIAAGRKLSLKQSDIGINGWAMECRVYAEDPYRNFLPSIGRLTTYKEPVALPGHDPLSVRVDSGISEGSDIAIWYDPLISKLATHGASRQEAIERMNHALDSYIIRGQGNNNISFLRAVMDHPRFRAGNISTKFIQQEFPSGFDGYHLTDRQVENLLSSALAIHLARTLRDKTISSSCNINQIDVILSFQGKQYHATATLKSSRESLGSDGVDKVSVTLQELNNPVAKQMTISHAWPVDASPVFHATAEGQDVVVQLISQNYKSYTLQYCGTKFEVGLAPPRAFELSKHMPVAAKVDYSNFLRSPMPGAVVSLNVKPGDRVLLGQELAVVEAMKMQNILRGWRDGVVKAVLSSPGQKVDVDQIILELEPEAK